MYTIFADQIVSVSDLKKRTKHWLDVVRHQSPVTVAQGSRADLVIVRRDDEVQHVRLLQYARLFGRFMMEHNQGLSPTELVWYKLLELDEQQEFVAELVREFSQMMTTGQWPPFANLLHDWQATAEANQNPELLTVLTAPHDRGEYVVVERPDGGV